MKVTFTVSKNPYYTIIAKHYMYIIYKYIYRGSYMSAHVLLNLLNELGRRDKMRGLPSILSLFRKSLINSIIQEHEC